MSSGSVGSRRLRAPSSVSSAADGRRGGRPSLSLGAETVWSSSRLSPLSTATSWPRARHAVARAAPLVTSARAPSPAASASGRPRRVCAGPRVLVHLEPPERAGAGRTRTGGAASRTAGRLRREGPTARGAAVRLLAFTARFVSGARRERVRARGFALPHIRAPAGALGTAPRSRRARAGRVRGSRAGGGDGVGDGAPRTRSTPTTLRAGGHLPPAREPLHRRSFSRSPSLSPLARARMARRDYTTRDSRAQGVREPGVAAMAIQKMGDLFGPRASVPGLGRGRRGARERRPWDWTALRETNEEKC